MRKKQLWYSLIGILVVAFGGLFLTLVSGGRRREAMSKSS